jgi:hypothetical protein
VILAALLLAAASPIRVDIVAKGDGFQLIRQGKPYVISGVGGTDQMPDLVAIGGNSMRGWGDDKAESELAAMRPLGLTYSVGIWLGHKSYFNYEDPVVVKKQLDHVQEVIRRLKNDPSVLMWSIGNEMEEGGNDTPALWKAIDDLHVMAAKEDPHHPAMTVVAEVSKEKIANIKKYAPHLKVLGINSYGGIFSLKDRLKEFGWDKPYVVTEFGPFGPWERPKTKWGASLEPTSTEKAEIYRAAFSKTIRTDSKCLGAYAFLWGHKQEETPTWFGMFLPSGERTEAVEVLEETWTGKAAKKQAPKIKLIDASWSGQMVNSGEKLVARVAASDPDGDKLTYEWSVAPEVTNKAYAGEGEQRPERLEGIVTRGKNASEVTLQAPKVPGPYRLYLVVRDGTGRAACANVPFSVN